MVWRAGVFSGAGVTVMGSVGVTTLHPQGPGDPEVSPMPDVAPSSLDDSSRVVRRDGDPMWTIPTNMAHESHSLGERLRRPRRSVVNSRLSKWMVLPRDRLTPVGLLPLATNESFGEGTIGTSRENTCCKSPFSTRQLSVFFAPARYRVVKIACSYSEVVLRTTKHTKFYPGSGPSL
jgi:hypothetical protein